MVYITTSMNFLLFIFEAIAEMSSCKNVNSLSPFSEEELHIEQNVEKNKRQMWKPRT